MKKGEDRSYLKFGGMLFLLYLCIHYWDGVIHVAGHALSAALPLFIGCIIAYLVNILMVFYERHYFGNSRKAGILKSRRPVCMILAFLTLITVVVLIILIVIPELASCIQLILAELPKVMRDLVRWCDENHVLSEGLLDSLSKIDWRSRINDILQVLGTGIGSAVDVVMSVVSSVVSGVATAAVGMIFAIYLLAGKEKLQDQFARVGKRYVKIEIRNKINYVTGILNDCFHRYIVGQCTEAVILGVLCALGMVILRLPYASMVGVLIGFTALIPIVGAWIGAFVGAFMIFTVSPVKAVVFLIFIVVLQQVEGNLIYPKVVGSSLGLPAVWVLAAVTIGGGILGIPGMLLGVPLTAAVYRVLKEDVNREGFRMIS